VVPISSHGNRLWDLLSSHQTMR